MSDLKRLLAQYWGSYAVKKSNYIILNRAEYEAAISNGEDAKRGKYDDVKYYKELQEQVFLENEKDAITLLLARLEEHSRSMRSMQAFFVVLSIIALIVGVIGLFI